MVLQFCPWNKLVILSLQILMFSQSWSKIVSVAWKATNHISTKCLNCIWSPKPTESPQFEFVDSLFYHCYIFDFQAKICQQMYEENFNMIGTLPPFRYHHPLKDLQSMFILRKFIYFIMVERLTKFVARKWVVDEVLMGC